MNTLFLIVAALALCIILPIILKKKLLIYWMGILAVFLPFGYIDRYFVALPTIVRWIPQLIFMGTAVLSVFYYRNTKLKIPASVFWVYLLFIIVGVLSMFYNQTPFISFIFAQRGFLYVIAAIFLMKCVYEKYTLDDIYTFIVKAGLILAGIAVFQRVVFVSLLRINSGDMITGGFAVDGEYLFFQVVCIIIVMAYWFKDKKLIKLSPKNTILILIGSIAVANNKAGLVFIIAVMGFLVFQIGLKLFWRKFKVISYIVILLFAGLFIFNAIIVENVNSVRKAGSFAYLTDPQYISEYIFGDDSADGMFSKGGELRRGAAIEFAFNLIKDNPLQLLLGRGPGAVSSSKIGGAEGYLSLKYPGYNIERSAVSMLLSEMGLLGLGMYYLLLLVIYFRGINNFKLRQEHKIIIKTIVFFMVLYSPYHNIIFLLSNALIISVILYPNLEMYFKKGDNAEVEQETLKQQTAVKFY